MKKILILFGKKEWDRPAFSEENEGYKKCYEHLYMLAEKNGVKLYRASYTWYDAQKNIFSTAWIFEDGEWKRIHNIKPDLIYDKTSSRPATTYFKSEISSTFPIVNDTEFSDLIDNKLLTSLLFPQHCKKHYKATDANDLKNILKRIKTSKVVLKKTSSSGGKDVHIFDTKDCDVHSVSFPILVQEFIDSSQGINNITDSIHDFRLVFIENDLIYSYVRTPAKGSLLANLSQGGSMHIVPNNQLPKALDQLIADVQNTLSTFKNKIYTVDLMFDENQKPWIVELNSMPGLFFDENHHEEMVKTYIALINLLKKA